MKRKLLLLLSHITGGHEMTLVGIKLYNGGYLKRKLLLLLSHIARGHEMTLVGLKLYMEGI